MAQDSSVACDQTYVLLLLYQVVTVCKLTLQLIILFLIDYLVHYFFLAEPLPIAFFSFL